MFTNYRVNLKKFTVGKSANAEREFSYKTNFFSRCHDDTSLSAFRAYELLLFSLKLLYNTIDPIVKFLFLILFL